ncbi:MAG: DEAD/DEAH box helicase family protein [Clostridium sp.]|uniref:DEAD/DEAH box helicase family protein n=1 Tax=Clostridium sp. TaxID=1506 RepID=UPI003EE4646C
MNKIKIIDSIMGAGKTSYAIQMMNDIAYKDKKFIFITPYLSEIDRVKSSVTTRKFYEPNEKLGEGSKFKHFKKMLQQGNDIVSTHSLFSMMDTEAKLYLKEKDYILILDEVFQVIEKLNISKSDTENIIDRYVNIEKDGLVVWTDKEYKGEFDRVKAKCDNNSVYAYGNSFLFWTFPSSVFELFEEVFILTYLFDGQIQKYYYDMFNIKYEYKSVKLSDGKYSLYDYNIEDENRGDIAKLINIYEGKMNTNYYVSESKFNTELSSSWLDKCEKASLDQIKKNMTNFVKNICHAKVKEVIWTTKISHKNSLKNKGYGTRFLPMNIRATNDYKESSCVMYVYNRYLNPLEGGFFSQRGISVNQDILAISDLLQFIWRSRIREGKPIDLYIPSSRMRELLKQYLNNEI